ncbi:MAG: DUF302 domain-containing protein [Candidatus Hodarchaeales archaeon]|jgi:uncharacterized protein (DUF302 family)
MPKVDILKKEIMNMSFDDAVEHVQTTVANGGFTVMFTKAIDEVIKKKLGVEKYPRYTTILACGADLAKMALDVNKDVSTLFPCSFVVYEDENKIMVSHVSIMKIAAELEFASKEELEPIIKITSDRVHAAWEKI